MTSLQSSDEAAKAIMTEAKQEVDDIKRQSQSRDAVGVDELVWFFPIFIQ